MELKHSFTVPVPVDEAWGLLLDLERIVPALPGASLDTTDGDAFTGRVKVKIGSIQMAYKGQGKFTEKDATARRTVIEAAGKDTRGAGSVSATIICALSAEGIGTRAEVVTDLAVTGRPAQFGRGLLAEVGGKILDQFAVNLAAALQEAPAKASTVAHDAAGQQPAAKQVGEPGPSAPAIPEAEPLDLISVAGVAAAKRVALLGGAIALLVLALRLLRVRVTDRLTVAARRGRGR